MNWLETVDGYVRRDAIINVYISQYYPGAVYVLLTSGNSVKAADFGKDYQSAEAYLSELMRILIGDRFENEFVRLLP